MGKFLHKNRMKNIPLYAAAVMLCLTLISTYFVAGLYARYASSSQVSDEARVAKFTITGDELLTETITAEFTPGSSLEKILNIYNNSEVAVEYTLSATNFTKNLPLTIKLDKAGTDPDAGRVGTTNTFKVQQLPGNHTDQYTLKIEWPAAENSPELMGKVDYITVTVTAVQID